jgi:fermentation-respiration switch protein FrsA (DUF1100 family)
MNMCTLGRAGIFLATAIVGLAFAPTAPAQPPTQPNAPTLSKLERFLKIRTPGAAQLAADGSLYVRDWPDGIFQLYRVEGTQAKPGTPTTKLTHFQDGLSGYSVAPDGKHILLFHAAGGNENTQISLLDPSANNAKGNITPLLSDPKVQFAANAWLPDSSAFLYTANDASPNDFHIYLYEFAKDGAPGTSSKILANPGSWSASEITPDRSRALVSEYRSASDSSIYELDIKSGKLTDLTPKPAAANSTSANDLVGYLPGFNDVLLLSDIDEGKAKLFIKDLKSGELRKALSSLDQFEIDSAGMNRDKSLLYAITNEDGYGVLHLFRLPDLSPVALPDIPKGVITVNDFEGNTIVYSLNNAQTPGLAFMYNVPAKDIKMVPQAQQLTFADTQGIDLSAFPLPDLIKYKSSKDNLDIPAFLWLPPNYNKSAPKPIPFLVLYHGGPESQHRPTFSAAVQFFLSEGFGILMPNVRGSTGYGRAFHMMDDYKKRWDSVTDGVDAAEWLVANHYASPGKISTWGGSYGGFMSVACLVEDQNRVDAGKRTHRLFGAGINVVGIVNLRTFLEKTSGYRRKLREVEYGPLSDPDFLLSVSSMSHIDKINVPMFIAHGFNDPRVPVEEAMQLAAALKDKASAARNPALMPRMFIAPDEGHGFAKYDNRLYFSQRMNDFLKDTIAKN